MSLDGVDIDDEALLVIIACQSFRGPLTDVGFQSYFIFRNIVRYGWCHDRTDYVSTSEKI